MPAVTLIAVALSAAIAGCASGVVMTDNEAKACREVGCAVFTERELLGVMGRAYKDGCFKGWSDSNVQGSRAL